jgi:hypothetical protein
MPVLDSERIVAEDGLVGEGDHVLVGVGGDHLFEEHTVDLRTISRQVAGLGIAPQTAGRKRRSLAQNSDQDAPATPRDTQSQCMARAPASA